VTCAARARKYHSVSLSSYARFGHSRQPRTLIGDAAEGPQIDRQMGCWLNLATWTTHQCLKHLLSCRAPISERGPPRTQNPQPNSSFSIILPFPHASTSTTLQNLCFQHYCLQPPKASGLSHNNDYPSLLLPLAQVIIHQPPPQPPPTTPSNTTASNSITPKSDPQEIAFHC
jgi:hypothetical protein